MAGDSVLRQDDHDRGLHHVESTVVAVRQATPSLLRVTLQLPEADRDADWGAPNVALRLELATDQGEVSRVYTVRTFDEAAGRIDVDVVVHGNTSPMMRWAAGVSVGDTLRFRGPRPHFRVPAGNGRPAALFLDETAIPALYALLLQWPAGQRAVGWVATDDAEAFAELPSVPGVRLHRVSPEGAQLAVQARALADAAAHVVWGAGERDEMRTIRRLFRTDLGLAKEDVAVFGYWRRGTTSTEIDEARLANYQRVLDQGGTITELDDLAIGV